MFKMPKANELSAFLEINSANNSILPSYFGIFPVMFYTIKYDIYY